MKKENIHIYQICSNVHLVQFALILSKDGCSPAKCSRLTAVLADVGVHAALMRQLLLISGTHKSKIGIFQLLNRKHKIVYLSMRPISRFQNRY